MFFWTFNCDRNYFKFSNFLGPITNTSRIITLHVNYNLTSIEHGRCDVLVKDLVCHSGDEGWLCIVVSYVCQIYIGQKWNLYIGTMLTINDLITGTVPTNYQSTNIEIF